MPSALIELTAIYLRERHRWGETIVADCMLPEAKGNGDASSTSLVDHCNYLADRENDVTIKLTAEVDELTPRLSYRFFGHWAEYTNKRTNKKQKQFLAKTFVLSSPHGRAGVIRYLIDCPHVGRPTAEKLWNKFHADAVRILRESPDVAAAAIGKGFSQEKAEEAAADLVARQRLEDCSIDLIDLLGGRGFPRNTAKQTVAEWGNKGPELIRKNPYLLMRFRGCGFLRTDKMYLDLGGSPARLKRQALCVWHALYNDTEGHTWRPLAIAVAGLQQRIGRADIRPAPAVKLAKRAKLIATRRDERGELWLAEGRRAENETYVAARVAAMLREPHQWPDIALLADVSGHQRQELGKALQSPLAIFGGSPGTGKTFSLARLVARIIADHGSGQIAAAAPTGKAAVRLTELLAGYGVPIRATTIHSLLRVCQRSAGEGWAFEHNEKNWLPFRFLVVDEASMVDVDLAAAFFRAVAPGTQVLWVGDINQLPPVGHGAVLRDLIAAGVPYGELREIWRNAGTIVRACAAIRDGKSWPTDEAIWLPPEGDKETPPRNLKLIPTANNAATVEKIVETLHKLVAKVDPAWDCQVLVAVNAKSELSRHDFNRRLQAELNPGGAGVEGSPFRVGDKVVNLKNGWCPVPDDLPSGCDPGNEDGKLYVANGEIGRVMKVEQKRTMVSLGAPKRLVVVPRGTASEEENGGSDEDKPASNTGCNWDLGYALSVHKSQGSEFPIVLVAIDEYPGARMVCSREWLYTAISRARRFCLLVGKRAVADGFCRRLALRQRKTFLKELIEEARKQT